MISVFLGGLDPSLRSVAPVYSIDGHYFAQQPPVIDADFSMTHGRNDGRHTIYTSISKSLLLD
jgi:hypothetical protein